MFHVITKDLCRGAVYNHVLMTLTKHGGGGGLSLPVFVFHHTLHPKIFSPICQRWIETDLSHGSKPLPKPVNLGNQENFIFHPLSLPVVYNVGLNIKSV